VCISTTAGTAITPVTITNTGGDIYYYSISPALPNGLSFNTSTGAISGDGLCSYLKNSHQS
jgi:hypothetical protein